jgi:hypothetical protein
VVARRAGAASSPKAAPASRFRTSSEDSSLGMQFANAADAGCHRRRAAAGGRDVNTGTHKRPQTAGQPLMKAPQGLWSPQPIACPVLRLPWPQGSSRGSRKLLVAPGTTDSPRAGQGPADNSMETRK